MLGTCPSKHHIYPNARHGYYLNQPLKNTGSLLICLKVNQVFHVMPKQKQSQVQPIERREYPVILYSIHFIGQVGDNRGRGLQV